MLVDYPRLISIRFGKEHTDFFWSSKVTRITVRKTAGILLSRVFIQSITTREGRSPRKSWAHTEITHNYFFKDVAQLTMTVIGSGPVAAIGFNTRKRSPSGD